MASELSKPFRIEGTTLEIVVDFGHKNLCPYQAPPRLNGNAYWRLHVQPTLVSHPTHIGVWDFTKGDA